LFGGEAATQTTIPGLKQHFRFCSGSHSLIDLVLMADLLSLSTCRVSPPLLPSKSVRSSSHTVWLYFHADWHGT